MTAQKMGKEILTGAGYEVIAVSNGAAAAKKLAEKPDICILDIIMPGYTGIEVCEKIRSAIDTAKMPVLLTVGKMEHFDQKDIQRVNADGVIIKPFEASDLLATIQKFAEKLSASAPKAAAAAASHDKTMIFTPPNVEEFKDDSYNQWKSEAEVHDETTGEMPAAKKAIEVPAEVAAAPAFLDAEHESVASAPAELAGTSRDKTVLITPPAFASAESSAVVAAPAMEFAAAPAIPMEDTSAGMPAFDLGASIPAFIETPAAAPAFDMSAAVEPSPAPAFDMSVKPAAAETPQIETFTPTPTPEASAISTEPAIEFTAQAPVEVNPPVLGGFQATAHAPVEVGQAQDPALATGTEGFDAFKTAIGTGEPSSAAPAEDDFEARVAAAMEGFEEKSEAAPAAIEETPVHERTQRITAPVEFEPTPSPAVEDTPAYEATQIMSAAEIEAIANSAPASDSRAVPEGMMDAALVEQMQAAVANLPVETAPVEEPVASSYAAEPAVASTQETPHQDLELAKALAAAVGAEAPPAAAEHPAEVQEIAHTVKNVFERMLPSFMEEVKRELVKKQKP
jgi:CheY-like chemotaxis protein